MKKGCRDQGTIQSKCNHRVLNNKNNNNNPDDSAGNLTLSKIVSVSAFRMKTNVHTLPLTKP